MANCESVAPEEVERHPADGWPVLFFENGRAFEAWLEAHHGDRRGIWLKLAKKGRGIPSITFDQALEAAMCFGWVDSRTQGLDDDHYLLRYQPRKPRSNWSARNKVLGERLIAEGRMRPSGLAEIEAAKSDGRWGT